MKKHLCLLLAIMLCLLSIPASALYVPQSTSKLPDMPAVPNVPAIIRVQKSPDSITLALDGSLPEEGLLIVQGLDATFQRTNYVAHPQADGTYRADGLPTGIEWVAFELFFREANGDVLVRCNAGGGVENISWFDLHGNEYMYDRHGRFCEFADGDTGLRTRFNTRGVMTHYGYQAFENTIVWFSKAGELLSAEYDDGAFSANWEPGYGWYVDDMNGRHKLTLDVPSPWNAQPLLTPDEPADAAEVIHYPNNTIMLCGLTLQEADSSLPDKWYNVLPVDLTQEGRQTCQLMISNMFLIGEVYVDVWGDEVTVSISLLEHGGVHPQSWYGRWFTRLSDITAASIESDAEGFAFGEPVSISRDLAGADTALLFIRGKASYYQPFRDGTSLTRYWRNKEEWKEFRRDLQELLPGMEK